MKTSLPVAAALLALVLAACDRPAATVPAGPSTDADRAAILQVLKLPADPQGKVMNACGELVVPQFLPAELGGSVGTAILFAIGGGPQMASCYGDGPDLHLFARDGGGWREVYSARGRMLIILPSATGGVRDLADGGPGFSFPVWSWDGSRYVPADRDVADADLATMESTYLP